MRNHRVLDKQSLKKQFLKSISCIFMGFFLVLMCSDFSSARNGLGVKPSGRPADRPLPSFEQKKPAQAPKLKIPAPAPPSEKGKKEDLGIRIFIKKIEISGNTVFSAEELARITKPYTNRELTTEDLDTLRQALTILYINKGYINSGAVIPDQPVENGVIQLKIIEGELTAIEVKGNKWFSDNFIKKRIALGADKPLNLNSLQERLQLLQQNQLIERLYSTLKPGLLPGQSVLQVEVEEQQPVIIQLGFDNYQSPTVGAEEGWVTVAHRNLSGHGDTLSFAYGASEGATPQFDISYTLPFTVYDTALTLRYRKNEFDVVEEPFDDLDVESKSEIYEIGIRQPLYRSLTQEFALSLTGERSRDRTYLLGGRFSFTPGEENGESIVTALRFAQEWTYHSQERVIAARSQFSFGLNALNSTIHSGETPDSRFVAWLGQFQWVQLVSPWDVQLILRTDLQLTNDSLLPLEQMAVGGRYSVRGYRENQLVRDQGFTASLEARIPLVRDTWWAEYLQLAPFVDFGKAWNKDLHTPSIKSLASVGLGLRWATNLKVSQWTLRPQLEIYWGVPLRDVDTPDNDLQDDGIHLQFIISGF